MAASETRRFEPGSLIAGTRYRVVRCVGRGGMGCVYEVEQVELGRHFVLKALLPEHAARDDLVVRLQQESRALGRLRHPNIVDVTDAGRTADGAPFFVMELLRGETLRARLRRERRLPVGAALSVVIEVLEGLAAAHDLGIVHRDVKPGNVFLLETGRIKLLDFGVAKLAAGSAAVTGDGVTIGTPRYLAPEQVRGGPIDGRADLYSVGLLLFEMVTGQGPFDADRNPDALLLAHLTASPPPLGGVVPGVDPALARLVERLLAKQPAERPSSARTVASALRSILSRAVLADGPPPQASALHGGPPEPPRWEDGERAPRERCPVLVTEVIQGVGVHRPLPGRVLVTERIPPMTSADATTQVVPRDPERSSGAESMNSPSAYAASEPWGREAPEADPTPLVDPADAPTEILDASVEPAAAVTHTALRRVAPAVPASPSPSRRGGLRGGTLGAVGALLLAAFLAGIAGAAVARSWRGTATDATEAGGVAQSPSDAP